MKYLYCIAIFDNNFSFLKYNLKGKHVQLIFLTSGLMTENLFCIFWGIRIDRDIVLSTAEFVMHIFVK